MGVVVVVMVSYTVTDVHSISMSNVPWLVTAFTFVLTSANQGKGIDFSPRLKKNRRKQMAEDERKHYKNKHTFKETSLEYIVFGVGLLDFRCSFVFM